LMFQVYCGSGEGRLKSQQQLQILRLTTPELKKTFGAPFAQVTAIFVKLIIRVRWRF
jgi:hypothetical protein